MTYTYEYEEGLPRLPVPLLTNTSTQLLNTLKPLLSVDEYNELLQESSEFLSHEVINLIQRHLVAASLNPNNTCYLNCVNNGTSPGIYGEIRGDILPRNPYLILEEDPYAKTVNPPNQSQRAANLVNSSLKFVTSLRNDTLQPDRTPKNGNPLSMNCYNILFGTTRVPLTEDENSYQSATIQKFNDINDSRHIVIICNNQYYCLEVLTEYSEEEYKESKTKHKIWFSDYELSIIFQGIINNSNTIDRVESINNSIGSLTTQSFSIWKISRSELNKSNKKNLELIDNALFIVVLDPNLPDSDQEKTSVIAHGTSELLKGTNMQVGSCTSRWYDKLQLVVTKNSVAGVVWESSSTDGTAILRFISDIYADSILKLAKNINGAEYTLFDDNVGFVSADGSIKKPESERLIITRTPELLNLIRLSETRLADLIHQHEYKTLTLKLNTYLVNKFELSIDSVLQVAFQIANYTLYGSMANTLEPITTRKFRDSRTELIPVQNDHISRLVKLFITNSNSSLKWDLFRECCSVHTKQYRNAMNGKGFERHFNAIISVLGRPHAVETLNKLNADVPDLEPIPDIKKIKNLHIPLLSNPTIEKLSSPELLISNCGNPALHMFGIPPAADQGFGIGYVIHGDKIIITVSSKFRQTERFLRTFKGVMKEFLSIIKQKSNFLININDSESRKLELQRLRIEHELKNINKSLPLTKHPIELTVEKTRIPIENVSIEGNGDSVQSRSSRSNSLSDDYKEDYDILGGYGYFNFGDLDMRSDELSREESFLNSTPPSLSSLNSKQHSSTNLHKAAMTNNNSPSDIKQKFNLSAEIRDRLLLQDDYSSTSSVAGSMEDASSEGSNENSSKPKKLIGRELDISDVH
jgi:carnitine O-acetyltransferase